MPPIQYMVLSGGQYTSIMVKVVRIWAARSEKIAQTQFGVLSIFPFFLHLLDTLLWINEPAHEIMVLTT